MSKANKPISPGQLKAYGALPAPRLTPELLSLVRDGKVYSLGVVYRSGETPVFEGMVSYTIDPLFHHGLVPDIAPVSGAAGTISMSAHCGTHIDALCHIGEVQDAESNPSHSNGEVRIYDDKGKTVPAADYDTPQGQVHNSIAEMPPIVTRGVLLDVAGCKGVDVLPANYGITIQDVEDTIAWQGGPAIQPGTAVLVRTGFYKYFEESNAEAFNHNIAGVSLEAGRYLLDKGIILLGADNETVEQVPPTDQPLHRLLLVHNGVTMLEILYLEELARERVYEFLLVLAPIRMWGATASWVNPLAIA